MSEEMIGPSAAAMGGDGDENETAESVVVPEGLKQLLNGKGSLVKDPQSPTGVDVKSYLQVLKRVGGHRIDVDPKSGAMTPGEQGSYAAVRPHGSENVYVAPMPHMKQNAVINPANTTNHGEWFKVQSQSGQDFRSSDLVTDGKDTVEGITVEPAVFDSNGKLVQRGTITVANHMVRR